MRVTRAAHHLRNYLLCGFEASLQQLLDTSTGRAFVKIGELPLAGRKTVLTSIAPETRVELLASMPPLNRAKALNSLSPAHRRFCLTESKIPCAVHDLVNVKAPFYSKCQGTIL